MTKDKEEIVLEVKRSIYNDLIKLVGIIIIISVILLVLIFIYTLTIDRFQDVKACKIALNGFLIDRDYIFDGCYANDDSFKLNFQEGISCSCYYFDKYDYQNVYVGEFKWLKSKELKIK